MYFLEILGSIFFIQISFFVFASIKKTDKLTDISYGITFPIVGWLVYFLNTEKSMVQLLALVAVSVWGFRLAGYLFYRIMIIKKDKRFDGIRESFIKFGMFWLLQTFTIFIVMLPVSILLEKGDLEFKLFSVVGLIISFGGIVYQSIADIQKFAFKRKQENKDKIMCSGLWKYSRHPNYLGEILMWIGIWAFGSFYMNGIDFLSVISPVFIFILLRYVSGVTILEKRWKGNLDYEKYQKSTPTFFPRIF